MRFAILVSSALTMAVLLDAVSGDLVCGSSSCSAVRCNNLAASSCKTGSVYKEKHSGKCACCPACVTYLDIGARCQTYSKELGETPASICRLPQLCISGTCQAAPLKYKL